MQLIESERDRLVLRADAKTLRDISKMLINDGRFKALPGILGSIADDLSSIVNREEDQE